jgi:hypothetical protein
MLLEDAAVLREDKARACETRAVYPEFYRAIVDGIVEETGYISVVER